MSESKVIQVNSPVQLIANYGDYLEIYTVNILENSVVEELAITIELNHEDNEDKWILIELFTIGKNYNRTIILGRFCTWPNDVLGNDKFEAFVGKIKNAFISKVNKDEIVGFAFTTYSSVGGSFNLGYTVLQIKIEQ